MLNLASLLLGLAAWVLGLMGTIKKHGCRLTLGSFGCCALALVLELYEVRRRAELSDWAALMDTMPAVTLAASVLLIVTVLLNLLAMRKVR